MLGYMDVFANNLKNDFANGNIQIGISSGIDAALRHADKLVIDVNLFKNDRGACIVKSISHIAPNVDPTLDSMLVYSAIALISTGAIDLNGQDVVKSTNPGTKRTFKKEDYSEDSIEYNKALTLICATKLNFYTTNHHTGQGALSGYPKKVFNTLYNNEGLIDITAAVTTTIHRIGHWGNTRSILHAMGIPGISVQPAETVKLTFADDFKIRLNQMPAGTASLSICYEITRRLVRSKMVYALEDPTILKDIVETYERIKEDRTAYHMSAQFLTNAPRKKFEENKFTQYLGVLGTYIDIFYPNGTLAKSPRIRRGTTLLYKDYETYDESFENLCKGVKQAMVRGIKQDYSFYAPAATASDEEKMNDIDNMIKAMKFT